MDDTVQDLIETKEVEDHHVLEDQDARECVIKQSMVAVILEPNIGMEFKSPNDAQQYYNDYARGKEHNHALASPMSTRFIRSHRTKTKVQKDLMDVLDDSGIRPRLFEKATRSSKHYDLAIRGIKNLCDELDTLAIGIVDEGKKPASIDDSRMLEDDNVLYSGITLRDSIHVISKGCPPSLRKKSSVEESGKKSKTCSSCNRKGHTKRTCESHQPNFESKSISTSQIVYATQD
ncbi:hypothetical protein V6N13_068412 [Hibiscus sabdariffa]|uniref:CCHC-type domain-containing protein n=1 Tax=Hibiscus sabdariffa TaxID=183260 RepID=A0ABR2QMU3_9ROSI